MVFFKKQKDSDQRREPTDSIQAGDFWLLLFVSVVILLFVFKFYS